MEGLVDFCGLFLMVDVGAVSDFEVAMMWPEETGSTWLRVTTDYSAVGGGSFLGGFWWFNFRLIREGIFCRGWAFPIVFPYYCDLGFCKFCLPDMCISYVWSHWPLEWDEQFASVLLKNFEFQRLLSSLSACCPFYAYHKRASGPS